MKKLIIAFGFFVIQSYTHAQVSNLLLNGEWMHGFQMNSVTCDVNNNGYVGTDSVMYILDISNPTPNSSSMKARSELRFESLIKWIKAVNGMAYIADGLSGLYIADVSNVYAPVIRSRMVLNASVNCVDVQGNYAYVADDTAGMRIIDVSNPNVPVEVGHFDLGNAVANTLVVSGNYAYIAYGTSGMRIVDISNPAAPTQVGQVSNANYNVKNLVLDGFYVYTIDVTSFKAIDVTNVASPAVTYTYSAFVFTPEPAITAFGNRLITSDGMGTTNCFTIWDLGNPASPAILGIPFVPGSSLSPQGLMLIGIHLFSTDSHPTMRRRLLVQDISNPNAVVETSSYDETSSNIDVCSNGIYTYVLGWDQSSNGLISIYNTANSTFISQEGMCRDTIVLSQVSEMVGQGNYLYVSDVRDNSNGEYGLMVVDVSNVFDPHVLNNFSIAGYTCKSVAVNGNYLFGCFYSGGLKVIDISNPGSPVLAGTLTLTGGFQAVELTVNGNYAYVADNSSNLHVIDVSNPTSPIDVGMVALPANGSDIAVNGNYAYVACGAQGLRIVDVSVPASPAVIGSYTSVGNHPSLKITYANNFVYLSDFLNGIQRINVVNPASPTQVGYDYDLTGSTRNVFVDGYHIFCVSDYGLYLFNDAVMTDVVNDPTHNAFTLTPNPSHDLLNLETDYNGSFYLEIFDLSGQLIQTQNQNSRNVPLDVSQFQRGIYFVRMKSERGEILATRKLIVE